MFYVKEYAHIPCPSALIQRIPLLIRVQ